MFRHLLSCPRRSIHSAFIKISLIAWIIFWFLLIFQLKFAFPPFRLAFPVLLNPTVEGFFATYYSTLDPPGLPRFISQLGCCPSAILSLKCILERFSESKQCPLVVYDSPFPLTALSDSHNLIEENFHAEFVITIACQVCFPLSFPTNPQLWPYL